MGFNKPLLAAGLVLSLTTLNAEASLTPYTSAGQNLVYSSVSDITWTQDANLLGTLEASNPNLISTIISAIGSITDTPNYFDTPSYSGSHTLTTADFGPNGWVNWFGAKAFASYLNTINYGGSSQWALPSAGANPQRDDNPNGSQFSQLFYNELSGTANSYMPNTANFTNEQDFPYWLGTEYAPDPNKAWYITQGYLDIDFGKTTQFNAWAVSPGQVSAVPVPSAVWLMGSGLLGLISLKRRGHSVF